MVEDAKRENFTLRVTGGVAIFHLAAKTPSVRELLMRRRRAGKSSVFADLDLVGYSNETKKLNKIFLDEYKFQKDKIINALFGDRRRIYYQPEGTFHVDIFLDKLEFNHDIDIRGRLELDYPTLNIEDLLLTKLQIHYINDKDLLDIIALSTLDSWDTDKMRRVPDVLSKDWGFYHDSMNNLKASAARACELMNETGTALQLSAKRIQELIDRIESTPKSKDWSKGAKQGPSKQYWREIEDVLR
jgi:hypothetical protein